MGRRGRTACCGGRMARRGIYDIIVTFFLIATLIFAVLLFLYLNASSAAVYQKVATATDAPRAASEVKDAVLACHRLEYLDASLMDAPCRAKQLLGGYRIVQYGVNGCEGESWDYSRAADGEVAVVPFVVAVEDSGGKRCLAKLEVIMPEVQR